MPVLFFFGLGRQQTIRFSLNKSFLEIASNMGAITITLQPCLPPHLCQKYVSCLTSLKNEGRWKDPNKGFPPISRTSMTSSSFDPHVLPLPPPPIPLSLQLLQFLLQLR